MNEGINEIVLRNRPAREPMSFERLKFLCYFAAGMVAMILGFIAVYMVIFFCGMSGR